MGDLIAPKNGKPAIVKPSSGAWDTNLASLLDVAASVMSKDLTPMEVALWTELLSPYSQEAIRWAFRQHLLTEKFFPKPAEILEWCQQWERDHDPMQSALAKTRRDIEAERFKE